MIFLNDEREALLDWIEDFDQISFDGFLTRACGLRLARFSTPFSPMPVIAAKCITWLDQNPEHVPGILQAALAEFPKHQSAQCFQAALQRFASTRQKQKAAGPPWNAGLINGVPMANRAHLRAALKNIVTAGMPEVVMIDGPDGTGRSHSWFLIQHVARSINGVLPIKIDVTGTTIENRTIETVFEQLVRKLQLNAHKPSTPGATVETIAARHADEIATAMVAQPRTSPAWLVFDSVDRAVAPEIKRFICELVQLRLSGELHNCKMFLLGAGRDFGVEDPFLLVELESLSDLLPAEVEEAAGKINALGARPLTPAKLKDWLNPVVCELVLLAGRQACKHASRKLVELRMEVGA